MTLPMDQDTTAVYDTFPIAARCKVINFTAGAAFDQYDFHLIGETLGGYIAEDIENGAVGQLVVDPFMVLQYEQSGQTFAVGDRVYWTGTAFSTTLTSNDLVGICTKASSDDVFEFALFGIMGQEADA